MGSAGGELGARIGGDEFAVVCPGADREAAAAVGQQIAAWFARVPRSHLTDDGSDCVIEPSVSWGVAVWPEDGRTKDELIAAADAALYVAKRGRGRRQERRATGATIEQSVRVLAAAIDARDEGTGSHSVLVADIAGDVVRTLGFDGKQVAALRRAALLHDSGKLALPDAILHKPAELSDDEHTRMREHSERGYEIAVAAGLPENEALWIRHVHEHWDGSGYPDGLSGDAIPLESRVLLVADAYAAMTHYRPNQDACSPAEALAELRRCAGTQFDPGVVEALATTVEPFTGLASGDAVPV
jgi:putative nucleotidyltransferase with HDIG domain